MLTTVLETLYGFIVAVSLPGESEDHRFSFVKKEDCDVYELGPYAGPYTEDPQKRWRLQTQAKLALCNQGYTVVL